MGRTYFVTFPPTAVTAAQDLLQIKGASGKMLLIKRQWCNENDTTIATSQMLSFRSRFLPATVTDGSGGGTPAISKADPGDAAASFTALSNNTTKATTGGSAAIQHQGGDHVYNGHDRTFCKPPAVGPSESFVFELLSTVSGTLSLSGGVEVEEIGG